MACFLLGLLLDNASMCRHTGGYAHGHWLSPKACNVLASVSASRPQYSWSGIISADWKACTGWQGTSFDIFSPAHNHCLP